MHIEFLLEEPSAEAALQVLAPRIMRNRATFALHVLDGKKNLLKKLPARLRGYARWLPPDWRIVVLVDQDEQDCKSLKQQLESFCHKAGLISGTAAPSPDKVQVINRIIVEELEAWFFGDMKALQAAYPHLKDFSNKAAYRNPDTIGGGTWENLERQLQKAGYYKGGLPKIELAKTVALHMNPERNTSRSFQVFRKAVLELLVTNTHNQ